jgi:hypothetical protein
MKVPKISYQKTIGINHVKTGADARKFRESSGVDQGVVADSMGLSAPQVCLMEKGERSWTAKTFEKYIAAVNAAKE